MKSLICEMCGGKELIKQDGVFVCQSCGTKYSVEEAKKMMVEIEDSAKLDTQFEIMLSSKIPKTPEKEKPIFANLQSGNSRSYQPQPQSKSQVIAFILCFFLGGLGAHRFYVGKFGTGILMLLFTVQSIIIFGIISEVDVISGRGTGSTFEMIWAILGLTLAIWILVDLIRILTGSFIEASNSNFTKDSNPKYFDYGTFEETTKYAGSGSFEDMLAGKTPSPNTRAKDKDSGNDAIAALFPLIILIVIVIICLIL